MVDDRIETIVDALVEGRAMWASVRAALGILLGGNLGEIGFAVTAGIVASEPVLSPRQLLLVNLLTDLAPALAVALRRPPDTSAAALLAEGPESSLGGALTEEILIRALATAGGATAAWGMGRLSGRRRRAATIALAALVGTQLGQTLAAGGRDPLVALTAVGSAGVLAAAVQTPGVSQFFGCTPLGPLGWAQAVGAAGAATGLALAAQMVSARQASRRAAGRLEEGQAGGAAIVPTPLSTAMADRRNTA